MKDAHSNPISHIVELFQLEKRDILITILLTLGAGVLAFTTPLAVQALVNVVTMGGVVKPLIVVSFILLALLLLAGFLYLLEYYMVELIQRRIFVRTALRATENAQAMQMHVADTQNTVELMNRFFDVSTVQKTSYQLLTKGLVAALQALLGSVVLMFYSFYFFVISLFLLFIAWLIVAVIGRAAIDSAKQESYAKYDVAAWLESIAYNLNAFKFAGGKSLATSGADALTHQYLERRKHHFNTLFKQNLAATLVYAIAGAVMLGAGGLLVMKGEINLGQFVSAELIIFGVLGAYLNFVSKLEYFYDLSAGLDKLNTIHTLPQERATGHTLTLEAPPSLVCKELTYQYSPHYQVFADVGLSIEAGSSVAILAATDAQCHALADTFVGLRLPTTGLIQLNGLDMRQLDLSTLRRKVAYVSHLEILEGTIHYNLTLGQQIALPHIQSVLQSLGLSARIEQLPAGLDTPLMPKGIPLSRMELRLLMIARSLLAQPYLMVIDAILDEMDAETLGVVSQALQNANTQFASPRTLVVVTQSASVAKHFGKVIQLKEGAA